MASLWLSILVSRADETLSFVGLVIQLALVEGR